MVDGVDDVVDGVDDVVDKVGDVFDGGCVSTSTSGRKSSLRERK